MSLNPALNISDLRRLAQKRLPRMVFDYIDGGADDEVTLRDNSHRFSDYQLLGHVLKDVSSIDLSTTIMGAESALPFVTAPTAAQRLFHPMQGERAMARAASKAGTIFSLSTLGSVAIEEIAENCQGPKWFQVYVWRDRVLVKDILDRVRAAGFTGLILTVDMPVAGNRERDPRNGFSIPPKITAKTAMQALVRPGYLLDLACSPTILPVNFPDTGEREGIIELVNRQFDNSVTWDYAAWLKEVWSGPLAIKGISRTDDAETALSIGANAVWLSNHGGRQLDTAPATIDLLAALAEAVHARNGTLIFDGGIRRGSDIAKALALGADGVAIGRAALYGLAAGGEAGVQRAIDILTAELIRTMQLLGAGSVADLTPDLVLTPK